MVEVDWVGVDGLDVVAVVEVDWVGVDGLDGVDCGVGGLDDDCFGVVGFVLMLLSPSPFVPIPSISKIYPICASIMDSSRISLPL